MKIYRLLFTILLMAAAVISVQAQNKSVKEGIWRGVFKVGETEVPFNFEVKKKGDQLLVTALNGERRDDFSAKYLSPDSLQVTLNTFEAALFVKIEKDGSLRGIHKSLLPDVHREIPFTAQPGQNYRFTAPGKEIKPAADITGKWLVKIQSEKPVADRVAVFEQKGNKLNGIILSITGDSRELQGDDFTLSGFTGSGPSYVKGKIIDGKSIEGAIGFGANATKFKGIKDDKAALADAYSLTFLKPGYDKLDFTFPDLNGKQVSLSDEKYKGKVVIIELMGTWCPNCIDQVSFLAPWYKENKDKGVEAIGLAFEAKDDYEFAKRTLTKLKTRYDVQYDLLFAGKNDKNEVAQKLIALKEFIAFPTTIIVGRDGKVREIHTGFSGKGTGQFYNDYVKKWNEDLAKLIAEPIPQSLSSISTSSN
jgi:peroxiredoxin